VTKNLSEVLVKAARKTHVCNWCSEPIEIGSSYVRQRNVDGNDAWTVRLHPECDEAFGTLDHFEQEESMVYGQTYTRGCTCERGDVFCDRTERCMGGAQ
jgi:hypothetical protein